MIFVSSRVARLSAALLVLLGLTVSRRSEAQLLAAEGETGLRPIEEVSIEDLLNLPVVTASGGKEQTQALAAANVTVIQREEIQLHGWRSLAEVLSNVPGLYVIDDGVIPAVGVRGVTGGLRAGTRIMKVMINGVAVNFRPDLTAFLGPEFIPLETVERVEIAKGPLSALYGANAFLATVNVITVPPEKELKSQAALRGYSVHGKGGAGGSAMLRYGSESAGVLIAVTQERLDRSGLRVSQTFPDQDPTEPRYQPFFADESRGDIAQPFSAFGQLFTRIGENNRLTFQGGLQQLDANGEFQLNSVLTHKTRIQILNAWSSLNFERQWSEALSSLLQVSLSNGRPQRDERLWLTANNRSSFQRNFSYWALDALAKVSFAPSESVSFDLGADYSHEPQHTLFYTEIFNTQFGDIEPGDRIDLIGPSVPREVLLNTFGAFAQASWAPITDLQLTGNARVDFSNLFETQVSWRAAAAYRWSKAVTTKLVVGRSFQNPSLVLLYGQPGFGNNNNVVGNRTVLGRPPLQPQTALSVEAVASANLADVVLVEVAPFVQQIENQIAFVSAGADFRAENRGAQSYAGVELRSRGSLGRVSPYLELAYQHSLQQAGAAIAYPDLWGRAGADLDLPEAFLKLNAQVRVATERGSTESNTLLNNRAYTLPAYALLDASLSTNGLKPLPGLETRVTLAAKNLLDDRTGEPGFGGFDLPSQGRTVMLELRQEF